jgi:hypothetical protein
MIPTEVRRTTPEVEIAIVEPIYTFELGCTGMFRDISARKRHPSDSLGRVNLFRFRLLGNLFRHAVSYILLPS